MRSLGFCRYLEEHGWRPWVVTTSPSCVYPTHPTDESLLKGLPQTPKVEVVPYVDPLQRLLVLRNRIKVKLSTPAATKHTALKNGLTPTATRRSDWRTTKRLKLLKRFTLDWAFSFPDPQQAWTRPVLSHFKSLGYERPPDVVCATGGPWTSLVIGKRLANRFNVPFVADFRDPWSRNPFFQFPSNYLRTKSKKLEHSVCAAASYVIANTEELQSKLIEDYPELKDRSVTITNGFRKEQFKASGGDLDSKMIGVPIQQPYHSNGVELCHFGTLYARRTPMVLLQSLAELFCESKIYSGQLRLRFVGGWGLNDVRIEDLAQKLEEKGFLIREPPVSHNQCLQQMIKADALLVLQPGSKLQIPGKIYEYLATGRPILAIGDHGATSNLMNKYQLGYFCQNDVHSIKDLFVKLVHGEVILEPPRNTVVDRFEYRSLTSQLVNVFDAACSKGSRACL